MGKPNSGESDGRQPQAQRVRLVDEDAPHHSRRGIYLLPNLVTSGALFAGFYAMVASTNGHFVGAGMAIIVALILDTADGRIARFTGTQSEFGAQYDSLSDMAAFGVAPALLVFTYALSGLGKLGWMVTFVYMACAALRLARFNTDNDMKSFTGLASPAAAVIIATSVWVLFEADPGAATDPLVRYGLAALTLTIALLMVSPFKYSSPKMFDFSRRVPFIALVGVVLVLAIILSEPPRVLFVLFTIYALSGPIFHLVRNLRKADTSD